MKRAEFPVREAKRLRTEGWTWTGLGIRYGVTDLTVRMRMDPEYSRQRKDRINALRRCTLRGMRPGNNNPTKVKRDAERLLAQIPRDTRRLTARMLGDPLPGRSALDCHATPESTATSSGPASPSHGGGAGEGDADGGMKQ